MLERIVELCGPEGYRLNIQDPVLSGCSVTRRTDSRELRDGVDVYTLVGRTTMTLDLQFQCYPLAESTLAGTLLPGLHNLNREQTVSFVGSAVAPAVNAPINWRRAISRQDIGGTDGSQDQS